ncbi:MAG: hypothetical protein GC136_08660 [Alphaproteobacteria bacterium]|nr:hypothetical protein [Alphaproteobacteria bacterium]
MPPEDKLFESMQRVVDVVLDGPHPTSKVAAGVLTDKILTCATNYWPADIDKKIGADVELGNTSGTIHAEMAAVLATPVTEGAIVFVTDPPCPNCMKNMIEAGVIAIYIDHKGFQKEFALKRGVDFQTMSLEMARLASINVYEIRRKERKIIPIVETFGDRPVAPPVTDNKGAQAVANVINGQGDTETICVNGGIVLPLNEAELQQEKETFGSLKYDFIQTPLNRLMMVMRRRGLSFAGDVTVNSLPGPREAVNYLGTGRRTLKIRDRSIGSEASKLAVKMLEEAEVLKITDAA